jgi:hypothetical protein
MFAPRWSFLVAVLALSIALPAFSQTQAAKPGAPCVPVNPNATPEARALLQMLCAVSGNAILSGQHNFPNHLSQHSDATAQVVGKYPYIWGSDFGFTAEGKDAITGRDAMIDEAKKQHAAGAVITLMWHVVRPVDNEPGGWKESVQNKLTDFEWSELITPGTNLNKRWMAQIDTAAGYLKRLQEAKIPVLWRPYHENNGDWFWWGGRPGERGFIALYRMTYDRMVNYHHLDNLIWVWNSNAPNGKNAGPYADYYPGADYVDVLATDVYGEFLQSHHDDLAALAKGKPIALGEVGRVPTPEILKAQPKWAWFMIWADFFKASKPEDAQALFNDPHTRNRGDELPWPIPVNYDEAKVGTYTLPDPLVLANGKPVRNASTWYKQRRPEIVRLFEENMQGRAPARPKAMKFDVFDKGTPAFGGKAIRKQVTVLFTGDKTGPQMDLALYLPAGAKGKVPVLLCIDFEPNSAAIDDPGLKQSKMWGRDGKMVPVARASVSHEVEVEKVLSHGFGVATVYYGDIEPDFDGGMKLGVRGAFLKPGQEKPAPDEWGAIGAWAWGLSRALDYLETDKGVDAKRVALLGLSRLGKTVLWAGARDPRFALVIESCSGEGGTSLSRRDYGETVKHLNRAFPYWFSENYLKFGDHVDQLPVDAHMLLTLIAPRPVLLQTGDQDAWADPKGEFLAAVAAEQVYRLLGKQGLGTDQMPAANQPILHTLGYSMHTGGHGILPSDWDVYLRFLEMHLK